MSIFKRENSPYYQADFAGPSGQRVRRSTGTDNRKEAAALEAKWKSEVFQQRAWGWELPHTFEELMVEYLRESSLEKRSAKTDRQRTKNLRGFFEGVVMNDLRPQHVRDFISHRRQDGVSHSTINRELSLLSAAINHAKREWEWELPNPVAGRKLREPEGRTRWLTKPEANALVKAAGDSKKAPYLADFVTLGLHTGCRKQELLGLEWGRVDLQQNLIRLDAEHTKSAKRRSVPLNRLARSAILNRARYRAEHCPNSLWVFAHPDGSRIGDIKNAFASACHRAGIHDFRMHDLRRACAARLVSGGVSLIEVRDLLGHSSVTMTERYAHLAPENLQRAAKVLEGTAHFGHTDSDGVESCEVKKVTTC